MKLFEFLQHIGRYRVLMNSRDIESNAIKSRHIADKAVTHEKMADELINELRMINVEDLAFGAFLAQALVNYYTKDEIDARNYKTDSLLSEEATDREDSDRQIVLDSVVSADFDDEKNNIRFYNKHGNVVCRMSADPFIVNGMIDDVDLHDGNLVFTFNTADGNKSRAIPLTDFFDADVITDEEMDDVLSD